jgi:hypothetical protein
MTIPMAGLLNENLDAINPPRIREEVDSKPKKNAFYINKSVRLIDNQDFKKSDPENINKESHPYNPV